MGATITGGKNKKEKQPVLSNIRGMVFLIVLRDEERRRMFDPPEKENPDYGYNIA